MRFSVSLVAEGDREVQLEEVVELADAVAVHEGIASGMGTHSYGAQIVVEADNGDEAVERAMAVFTAAVETAGLPVWPVVSVDSIADEEDTEWFAEIPEGSEASRGESG